MRIQQANAFSACCRARSLSPSAISASARSSFASADSGSARRLSLKISRTNFGAPSRSELSTPSNPAPTPMTSRLTPGCETKDWNAVSLPGHCCFACSRFESVQLSCVPALSPCPRLSTARVLIPAAASRRPYHPTPYVSGCSDGASTRRAWLWRGKVACLQDGAVMDAFSSAVGGSNRSADGYCSASFATRSLAAREFACSEPYPTPTSPRSGFRLWSCSPSSSAEPPDACPGGVAAESR
jgi:hypothetical protein